MRFAIINDVHLGPLDVGYKNGVQRKLMGQAEQLILKFVKKINTDKRLVFVVNLGDSIEDVNSREIDIRTYKKFLSLLSPLKIPIHHLIGNHDVRTLNPEEVAKILKYKQMYYSFDYGLFHFIALSFVMTEDYTHNLSAISAKIPDNQIDWLKIDLSKTNKPTIVFSHYGLADDDMKGNFWFEKDPYHAMLSNRKQIRHILEKSGRVRAVISAHQHWNKMLIHQGIPYFTLTSLIENTNNDGLASKAHTVVDLDIKKIIVKVKGNDPARFEYAFKTTSEVY